MVFLHAADTAMGAPVPTFTARYCSPALVALTMSLGWIAGCELDTSPEPRSNIGGPVADPDAEPRQLEFPLDEAPCTIHVEEYGDIDIEDDYIPNVVACENGNAPMEALKAQAVQARGFIYYKLFVAGADSVVNSEADQVYDCDYADAEPRHFQAAEATRGEYLRWNDEIIAPFYVAGAIPDDPDDGVVEEACVGTGGEDPTSTETWVTYNENLTGCDIEMTELGWAPDDCLSNPHNRGCASQNGQSCLADGGLGYEEMFPYYYGDDIELAVAEGECVEPDDDDPSDEELHCQEADDGWSCYDESSRILCDGASVEELHSCSDGCTDGECDEEPITEDVFCAEEVDDDGWYCIDSSQRVECTDGEATATETCTAGCENDACADTGQSPDDPDSDDESEDGDGDGDSASETDSETTGQPVWLVTESPGVTGGCHQKAAGGSVPAALLVALALLTATGTRRVR